MSHWYNYRLQGGGVRAPRLQADYWFPAPGRPASDTVWPIPGKINIICMGGIPTEDTSSQAGTAAEYSAPTLAKHIRRWLQKYGTQNLAVAIVWPVAETPVPQKYGWNGTAIGWYQTAWEQSALGRQKQAELWRWYVQDHEQLPVTVAVQVPHLVWRQTPDGRRVQVRQLQFNDFWDHDPGYTRNWSGSGRVSSRQDSAYGKPMIPVLIPALTYLSDSTEDNPRIIGPGDRPSSCAIVGRDGTMEHTSVEPDWMVNTRAAVALLLDGGGAPPRPGQPSWIDPY